MNCRLTIEIEPVAKERARVTQFGTYTPAKTRKYEAALALYLRQSRLHCFAEGVPLKLKLRFILARPKRPKHKTEPVVRPDTDNYLKAFKDAANGILWADDSQVVHVDARKAYDQTGGRPRIEMELEEIK
jgi:Holliday junction resolvase RusA-like endonuclease